MTRSLQYQYDWGAHIYWCGCTCGVFVCDGCWWRVSRFVRSILSSESLVNHLWTLVNLWILVYSVYLTLGWLSKIVSSLLWWTSQVYRRWVMIDCTVMIVHHNVELHLQFLLRKSKDVNATIQWCGDRPRNESHVGTDTWFFRNRYELFGCFICASSAFM